MQWTPRPMCTPVPSVVSVTRGPAANGRSSADNQSTVVGGCPGALCDGMAGVGTPRAREPPCARNQGTTS